MCKNLICTGLNPYYMDIDQLYCNGERIARSAVQHFISKGHRKIGYVGECSGDVRYLGYQQTLKDVGLDVDALYVFEVPQTMEGGREAARRFLISEDSPTAIFCVNDVSAIDFMETLQKLRPGGAIPEIMGVGDISSALSSDLTPPRQAAKHKMTLEVKKACTP